MLETRSGTSISRLILTPAIITLAVTLLRLVGELQHGPKTWFTMDMGTSIVAIVWLAPVFGIYFALKLKAANRGPASAGRALGFALLGVAIVAVGTFIGPALGINSFHQRLIFIWMVLAVGAVATLPGWPSLFKTLLAYAYAARIPVAIIMFFAYRGNWGTHYDAVPPDLSPGMTLWLKYLWLGFFPQVVFWVGFTIAVGMLFGSTVAALARLARRPAERPA